MAVVSIDNTILPAQIDYMNCKHGQPKKFLVKTIPSIIYRDEKTPRLFYETFCYIFFTGF